MKKFNRIFKVGPDRTLFVVGALFALLLVVDFVVVVAARAEPPGAASHQVKAKSKSKKVVEKESKTKPISDVDLKRYQYCGADSDCVKANNGCCDCANGGADVSVSAERLQEFNLRFECEKARCTKMAAVPECGSGVVSCVNHQCRYFTDMDFHQ